MNKFHDYEIWIGNSADPSECTKCAGGPHMTASSGLDSDGNWRGGNEVWCNLPGKYTHILADRSAHASSPDNEINICALGVMGNRYTRV